MGFLDFLFKKEEQIGGDDVTYNENLNATSEDLANVTGDFMMVVEDVFSITGRGTIVTGKIGRGTIRVGDHVKFKNMVSDQTKITTVVGIEMFRKVLDIAKEGDNVGLLLRGVSRDEISRGDVLFQGEI